MLTFGCYITYALAGVVVWIFIGLLCVYTMFLLALSRTALAILLALGPFFITMLLFENSRRLFDAWLAQLRELRAYHGIDGDGCGAPPADRQFVHGTDCGSRQLYSNCRYTEHGSRVGTRFLADEASDADCICSGRRYCHQHLWLSEPCDQLERAYRHADTAQSSCGASSHSRKPPTLGSRKPRLTAIFTSSDRLPRKVMKTMLAIAMVLALGACSTHRMHCRAWNPSISLRRLSTGRKGHYWSPTHEDGSALSTM